MTHDDLTSLTLFGQYTQPELAELWGYYSYNAIRRGIVTPSGTNIIILFVTENKVSYATQYADELNGDTLSMSGEKLHGNDHRLFRNLSDRKDTIYLFYRSVHHSPYIYYGPVSLISAELKTHEPSHFIFTVDSLKKEENKMRFFGFKISQPSAVELVNQVKLCKENIEICQLNQLDNELKAGSFVFVSLGGDKVPWSKGLIGLAQINHEPYDKGYDPQNPRNFKLGLKMLIVLRDVLKREELIYYPNAYDAAGIGPNTKGEQNQAIKALERRQAVSILRAAVDKDHGLESVYNFIFPRDFVDEIMGRLPVLIPESIAYGDRPLITLDDIESAEPSGSKVTGGQNILLYGVPGCGKSHTVKKEYCSDTRYMERVVFHPDYTYSDFVGQILPKVDKETKQIEYNFSAGPFTRILKKAVGDPQHMYYLVIEELNRGNAPAIFGDIFQLLDRKTDGKSDYIISNKDIAESVFGNSATEIYIPSNLTIISTMNTSDQSIFTLDTAFKRRWKMRMIKNDIDGCAHADCKILGCNITWKQFAKTVNKLILSENSTAMSTEDKRLGAYFVDAEDLICPNDEYNPAFAEKVIMYLWNDVFKYDRSVIFKEEYSSLEDVVSGFETEKFNVFSIDFSEN